MSYKLELMKDLSKENEMQDTGFETLWNSRSTGISMLEITRTSKEAYCAFLNLIAQSMVGSSKWKRFLDMGAIDPDISLSNIVTTADEAYGLLCLENSRAKWTEEATYRIEKKKWRDEKFTREEKDETGFPNALYSEGEDGMNGWDSKGIELCSIMNRKIMKFRREEVETSSGTMGGVMVNKQKLFDLYVKQRLCQDYGSKNKTSPLEAMNKRKRLEEREEHLQQHEYNFFDNMLVDREGVDM